MSEHPMQAGATEQSPKEFLCVSCVLGGGGGGALKKNKKQNKKFKVAWPFSVA